VAGEEYEIDHISVDSVLSRRDRAQTILFQMDVGGVVVAVVKSNAGSQNGLEAVRVQVIVAQVVCSTSIAVDPLDSNG
jgi:hypothetical protein